MVEFALLIIAFKAIQFVIGIFWRKIEATDIPLNRKTISIWILFSLAVGLFGFLLGRSFINFSIGTAVALSIVYLIIDIEEHWKIVVRSCFGCAILIIVVFIAYFYFYAKNPLATLNVQDKIFDTTGLDTTYVEEQKLVVKATLTKEAEPTLDLLSVDMSNPDPTVCVLTTQNERVTLYSQINPPVKSGEIPQGTKAIYVCRSPDLTKFCVITTEKDHAWAESSDFERRYMTDPNLFNCGDHGKNERGVEYLSLICSSCP